MLPDKKFWNKITGFNLPLHTTSNKENDKNFGLGSHLKGQKLREMETV
jgi:hypothetical protein